MSIIEISAAVRRLADLNKTHREALLEARDVFKSCPVNKEAANPNYAPTILKSVS